MARDSSDVKAGKRTLDDRFRDRCLDFLDHHPRVGWYIAAISTGNFLLSFFELVHH